MEYQIENILIKHRSRARQNVITVHNPTVQSFEDAIDCALLQNKQTIDLTGTLSANFIREYKDFAIARENKECEIIHVDFQTKTIIQKAS